MRKSRLVILPTRRLDRIGFLLLFLSCPVIGDWGRIQPDTEASDKAIQIAKEGTCGLQRDTSAQLPSLLNPDGSLQCRPSEFYDQESIKNPIAARRTNTRRMRRTSETERMARETVERRLAERRDVHRVERNNQIREETRNIRERTFRSRDVEQRRLSRSRSVERRNEPNSRSLSLSRLEADRSMRTRRDDATRRNSRLLLARQNREVRNERRETIRAASLERDNNRRSLRLSENRRDFERTQRNERMAVSRREDARRQESNQRRLFLARVEKDSSRRIENTERRVIRARSVEPVRITRNNEREVTRARSVESLRASRNTERRMDRNVESRRESDLRRSVALLREVRNEVSIDRRFRKSSDERMGRFDGMRLNRMTVEPKNIRNEIGLDKENGGEDFLGGVMKWIGLKPYESPKLGDWTTNCVIGAVTYFLTSRQVKSV